VARLADINNNQWKFTSIENIEESHFDRSLERFFGMGVMGLVRENIQNSLDGYLYDDKPVIVKIKTGEMKATDVPGIDNLTERINVLEGRNNYTKETIKHMNEKIKQNRIRYMSFEDENTKGLTGAENGQTNSKSDTWGIYAYNKGFHFEEENTSKEEIRGGSHGVGKIASNAASDIHAMFFSNCDDKSQKHLGGTVQLVEHWLNGQAYRSTGYFTDVLREHGLLKYYPYKNEYDHPFRKDTRGLKIIIPFLREEYDDQTAIVKSVCDSFFVSILKNKLEVHINDQMINKDNLTEYVSDEQYYEQSVENMKDVFTPMYVDTYLNYPIEKDLVVESKDETYHFKLFFKYDEKISKGRTAIIRTVGMKIEDFKVNGYATKPYNAVVIGDKKADAYLKSLENESHTEISNKHISDKYLKSNATRFINNLSRAIKKHIDDAIRENNQMDGIMDTEDIIYTVERKFKNDLQKATETVRVGNGKALRKTRGNSSKKEKRNKADAGTNATGDKGEKRNKRDPLKFKKAKGDGKVIDEKQRYSTYPETVERLRLDDHEILQFDFSNSKLLTGVSECDVVLAVIDGTGKEYSDEFKVDSNFKRAIDLGTGQDCRLLKNKITDVKVNNGIIKLRLDYNQSMNKSLKFIYYLEVE
jgi:hypothetical protein